jgi:hypothetical protein
MNLQHLWMILIAGITAMFIARPIVAQCDTPECGNCCAPHGPCENPGCYQLVCTIHPPCCETWFPVCADLAFNYCEACGGTLQCGSITAGDCCTANISPYCNNASCCEPVCAVDPFCCDASGGGVWDQGCADLAWKLCPDLPGCAPPPPPQCGDAGTGNCCEANGSPFCNSAGCCNAICELDPYCCEVEWDQCCADRANELCSDGGVCTPGNCEGSYCGGQHPSGCWCDIACCVSFDCCPDLLQNGICCTGAVCTVCDFNFYSCAQGACGASSMIDGCDCKSTCTLGVDCCPDICQVCGHPDCNPADLTGDNVVDVFDLLELLAQWGECERPCPEICPADFDDSGEVGVFDLLFLLANWG